jgi:hypothetical protein
MFTYTVELRLSGSWLSGSPITLVKKVLSHEEKCLFLAYFWTLNSNTFQEFLYRPNLSRQVKGPESSAPGH